MINTPYNSRNIIKQLRNADLKARKRLKKGKGYVTLEKKAARLIEAYMSLGDIRTISHVKQLLDSEKRKTQKIKEAFKLTCEKHHVVIERDKFVLKCWLLGSWVFFGGFCAWLLN